MFSKIGLHQAVACVLLLTFFSMITLRPQTQILKNQNPIPFAKIIPYLIEGGLIAGGIATSVIGYIEKQHCNHKIALLQRIDHYCKQYNIATTTLVNKDIFLFVQQLKQESLLLEIIHNNETQTTLQNESTWHNGLLYGGGIVVIISIIALIITAIKDQNEYHAQQPEVHPQTQHQQTQEQTEIIVNDEPPQTVVNNLPTTETPPLTIKKTPTSPPKQSNIDEMLQQDEYVLELQNSIHETLKQYKNPAAQKLTPRMLRRIFTTALEQRQTKLSQATRKLIQNEVLTNVGMIIQNAKKNGPGYFNDRVVANSLNRLGRVHAMALNARL